MMIQETTRMPKDLGEPCSAFHGFGACYRNSPLNAKNLWCEAQDRVIRSLNLVRSRNHLESYLLLRWARTRARIRAAGSGS